MVFTVRNVSFQSHGVTLVGRLVMPAGEEKVPLVILLHGAEKMSAMINYPEQRILPALGVGAFVYDKRGTGRSGGTYTQDFNLLADDGIAAMRESATAGWRTRCWTHRIPGLQPRWLGRTDRGEPGASRF